MHHTATICAHAVIAVLVGGPIVTALYLVPVLGAILFNIIGILGIGVVIYTLMLIARSSRQAQPARMSANRDGSNPHSPLGRPATALSPMLGSCRPS